MSEMRAMHRRIMNMVCRGVIEETDDTEDIQLNKISLLIDEGKADVERFQNYGFSSHPPVDTEVLAVFPFGGRDHGVIIATDDRASRFTDLKPGEVGIYSDEGDSFLLNRDNKMALSTKDFGLEAEDKVALNTKEATIKGSDKISLDAPTTNVSRDLAVERNVKANGAIDASGGFFQNGQPIGGGNGGGQGPAGPQGPPGPQGETGPAGIDGRTILSGTVAPTGELGAVGDFYVDTTTWQISGPKTAALWPAEVSLIGPQGPAGQPGATGPAGPAGPIGQDGAAGAPGQAATIEVGQVVGTAYANPPSITNVGTNTAARFDFVIPAGQPGATGSPGTPAPTDTLTLDPGPLRIEAGPSGNPIIEWSNTVATASGLWRAIVGNGGNWNLQVWDGAAWINVLRGQGSDRSLRTPFGLGVGFPVTDASTIQTGTIEANNSAGIGTPTDGPYPKVIIANPAATGYPDFGGRWQLVVGGGGNFGIQRNTALDGSFFTSNQMITLRVDGTLVLNGKVEINGELWVNGVQIA